MNKIRLLFFLILIAATMVVSAQKMSIGFIYPAGGETGSTVGIEIGGLNIKNTTEVLISGDGIVKTELYTQETTTQHRKRKGGAKLNDQSSPQLEERIYVKVTIDKKATPGLRDLRLKSKSGISNKLPFEVGQYPNQAEKKGSTLVQPNLVNSLPVTLCGQILPGEIDYFSFKGTKGMQLVAAAKGRTLVPYIADAVPGWFQPVMRITNSRGKEIAFCDDYRNNVDPVIITTLPETDTYQLTIQDAVFRGREDFNYRIDLGEVPYLEYITPAAGKVGKKTKVELKGVNLATTSLSYKANKEGYNALKATGKNGFVTNPLTFWGVSKASNFEQNPTENYLLETGDVIYETLEKAHQIKTYELYAQRNENIALTINARRIGSMMDASIRIKDARGTVVAESDDVEDAFQGLMTHHADPVVQYKAVKEGSYVVEVKDISGNYGPDYFYILERSTRIPNFEVFVSPATMNIPKGGTGLFRVDIISKEKFVPALDFSIKGLPKGYTTSHLSTNAGAKSWEISVTAPADAKESKLTLEVLATATLKGKEAETLTQKAIAADNMMQAFYYTHHIPAAGFEAAITEAAPFSLQLASKSERAIHHPIQVEPGDSVVPIHLKIERRQGFSEPIELNLNKKLRQITMDPVQLLPGETEKTIYLKIHPEARNAKRNYRGSFSIVGTVNGEIEKQGKRTFQNALYREYSPLFLLELNQQ